MKVSELVLTRDSFPNNIIQHYPALNSYIASILFPYPNFQTFNVYFIQIFTILVALFDIIIYLKVPFKKLIIFILISLILFSGSTPLNHNLLADIIIPFLIVLALIQIKVNKKYINLLFAGSLFTYAVFIKPPTAILLVLFAFINLCFIDNFWKNKKKTLILLFISLLIPYFLFLYQYTQFINININLSNNSKVNIVVVSNILNNFLAFFRYELLGPIFSLEPSKSSVNLIGIFFICYCFYIWNDRRNIFYIIFSLFIYLFYLAITYNFIVLDAKAVRFASFDRYFLSFYIYFLFYFIYHIFKRNINLDVWILLLLLFINICFFIPKLLLLFFPIFLIFYLLKINLQNKVLFISCLLPIFFGISLIIFSNKFYPLDYMRKNAFFFKEFSIISKDSSEAIIIEVCNPNQYDYLAFSYYSDFSNNFSIVEAANCMGDDKYRLASKKISR